MGLVLVVLVVGCGIEPHVVIGDDPPGGDGAPEIVVPVPGQVDVHPVAIDRMIVSREDRHLSVSLFFSTGLEPCSVLDSIVVQRAPGTIALTLMEGHAPDATACRLPLVQKRTEVDLGELARGRYLITDSGHAPTVEVSID